MTVKIADFAQHASDTGSAPVQIAALTARINNYTRHFREHPTDRNNQRGLRQAIGQRRRLLKYVRSRDVEAYRTIINALGIRPLPDSRR